MKFRERVRLKAQEAVIDYVLPGFIPALGGVALMDYALRDDIPGVLKFGLTIAGGVVAHKTIHKELDTKLMFGYDGESFDGFYFALREDSAVPSGHDEQLTQQ